MAGQAGSEGEREGQNSPEEEVAGETEVRRTGPVNQTDHDS